MASLKELKGKIVSLQKTQKITSAMKLIATNKFNRAQSYINHLKNYRATLFEIGAPLANTQDASEIPLLSSSQRDKGEKKKKTIVLITSDRGLCGSFNYYAHKSALTLLDREKNSDISMTCFGKKGYDFFNGKNKKGLVDLSSITRLQWPTAALDPDHDKESNFPLDMPSASSTRKVALELIDSFTKKETDEVYLCYNFFHSTISQKPTIEKWLPFNMSTDEGSDSLEKGGQPSGSSAKRTPASDANCIYDPEKKSLLEELIITLLIQQFYFALFSSLAGEHAARMSAMENASNNCGELIDSYTLKRNRARQAAITTELIEIISGSSSLE